MNNKNILWLIALTLPMILLNGCSSALDITSISGTWEPLSHVYLNFGNMVIGTDAITWESGQCSTYKISDRSKDELVVELTAKNLPKFHGTVYRFIKFQIKKSTVYMVDKQLDVYFYRTRQDVGKCESA